jgi:hypothetical protein
MKAKPDFFLSTAGESNDCVPPRACWAKARLKDISIGQEKRRDDYMLVEVDPPVIGQRYGLGGDDISALILASRLQGFTLFPVNEWPCPVYVTRSVDENILRTRTFDVGQVELIAWGWIFRTLDEANEDVAKYGGVA